MSHTRSYVLVRFLHLRNFDLENRTRCSPQSVGLQDQVAGLSWLKKPHIFVISQSKTPLQWHTHKVSPRAISAEPFIVKLEIIRLFIEGNSEWSSQTTTFDALLQMRLVVDFLASRRVGNGEACATRNKWARKARTKNRTSLTCCRP